MSCRQSTIAYVAMNANKACTFHAQRMQNQPARISTQAMCGMCATATASILLIQTGVIASVSLFILLVTISVVLMGLLSLSGLTGFILTLVGLLKGLALNTQTGD